MASGFGVNGGPGRCYSFWLDFTKCLANADIPMECSDAREDYFECLHHRKETQRRRAVYEQLQIRQQREKKAADIAPADAKEKPA